jgi:hypothetical protein
MAIRPLFIPKNNGDIFTITRDIDFKWYSGLSKSQKQKSISEFHSKAKTYDVNRILDISSSSEIELGVKLSAFNLIIRTKKLNKSFTVETAFQASKVFENGGPYVDLLGMDSRAAKKDIRLKESGNLIQFKFYNTIWSLKPRTAFYDWLYISALEQNKALAKELLNFDAFTDIEFNPIKSINCQARSAALYVSLSKRQLLESALESPANFLSILKFHYNEESIPVQGTII